MKNNFDLMQTMDMGSAEAALAQMSAVGTGASSSYFLQLDPSGHIDILESPLILSKPDMADETVYEIQLDPFVMDERNAEVGGNLPNFQNAVSFPPEYLDEHNNLITTAFNASQTQYQLDDISFNQMLMNNAFSNIIPLPQPNVMSIPETQEITMVETVPDFTIETEIVEEVEPPPTEGISQPTPPLENPTTEPPGKTTPKESPSEEVETAKIEANEDVATVASPTKEKVTVKKKWDFPEKLWDFNEEPTKPPYKEMYPRKPVDVPKENENSTESEPPAVITLSDLDEFDENEDEQRITKLVESEYFFDGLDPDDELYISCLQRPDESKTAMCILCYEWFNDSTDLDSHLKSVHRDNMVLYGCKRCGKQFWSRFLRQRHEKLHRYDLKGPIQRYHQKNQPLKYLEAKHYLKRLRPAPLTKDYVEMLRAMHGQIKSTEFECIECGKNFGTEEEYREHYDENHAVQTCLHCRKVFDNAKQLHKHEENDHGVFQVKKNYPGGAWKLWENSWDLKELKEKDEKILSVYLYHNYSKKEPEDKLFKGDAQKGVASRFFVNGCQEITMDELDATTKKKRKSTGDKSQGNSKSGKSSSGSTPGDSSKGRKNDPKLVACIEGDDDYDKIEFVEYTKSSKKRDLPYKCDTCKTSFDNVTDLQRHVKSHLIRAMAYMCQYCGRGFATHSNRKEHERIHTGDKPYVCPICSRAFVQISNLKKHIQTHKDKNNLQCSTCQKQFVKESSLILHQRAHSQDRKFRCHICDRAYNYASLLKRHMRIHTGENPYSCDDCGMQFHELVSLHYHRKKVHTGERPHRCELCSRAFILSSDLKKHLKIHQKNGNSIKPGKAKRSSPSRTLPPPVDASLQQPQNSSSLEQSNLSNSDEMMKSSEEATPMETSTTEPRSEGDHTISEGDGGNRQVFVQSKDAELLKSPSKNEMEGVIQDETKENNCLVLGAENHVEPLA